jgi:hypothetical protein
VSHFRAILAAIAATVGFFLTLPLLIAALPFWIVTLLTGRVTRLLEPEVQSWRELIEFNPALGWKPKPNLDTHCLSELGGDVFHVSTDSLGWPGSASIAESEVVVFGDSFAFGFCVNANALFSELSPNLRIKAIGAPGYNMVQELLWMRQLASQLTGKLVVWFIYFGNDLWENLQPNMQNYRTPFVRKVNGTRKWEIVTSHVNATKWWPYHFVDNLRSSERFAAVFGTTFLSERMYSASEFLIQSGRDICSHAGAQLVIMTIPQTIQLSRANWDRKMLSIADPKRFDLNLPDRKINEICSKLGVPFVAGKEHLDVRHYIPIEGHWNERGHRRIAKVLEGLHEEYVSRDGARTNSVWLPVSRRASSSRPACRLDRAIKPRMEQLS